jgi:hypothetical protein
MRFPLIRIWLLGLLLQACATTGSAGGLGLDEDFWLEDEAESPLPWEVRGDKEDAKGRRAEAAAAVEGMRGIASTLDEADAELSFRFWAQEGALTLLSWKRTTRGENFQRLWMKAQTRGLSAAEKSQFQKLLRRFEQLLDTKLDDAAKAQLRSSAKADFYTRHHPELLKVLVDSKNITYPIHHRTPLEYAHRFPSLDINSAANLAAADKVVHGRINNVWTAFRPAGSRASPSDIEKMVEIVDRNFSRWYNKVYDPARSAQALDEAEKLAISEATELLRNILK